MAGGRQRARQGLARAGRAASAEGGPGVTEGNTIRVMLCDDHEIVREGLRTLIGRSAGMSVVGEASTMHEAIETAAKARPDVRSEERRVGKECRSRGWP